MRRLWVAVLLTGCGSVSGMDIDARPAAPFTTEDLTRVRNELRALATDAAASGMLGDHGIPTPLADVSGDLTRAFREVAVRIEQRIDGPMSTESTDAHREG